MLSFSATRRWIRRSSCGLNPGYWRARQDSTKTLQTGHPDRHARGAGPCPAVGTRSKHRRHGSSVAWTARFDGIGGDSTLLSCISHKPPADVAQALLPAASALMPTFSLRHCVSAANRHREARHGSEPRKSRRGRQECLRHGDCRVSASARRARGAIRSALG